MVILASNRTVNSSGFDVLRDPENGKRPFIASVDPSGLMEFYEKNGPFAEKQFDARIIEMMTIALEVAMGKECPGATIVKKYYRDLRKIVFLPGADAVNCGELVDEYRVKEKIMRDA